MQKISLPFLLTAVVMTRAPAQAIAAKSSTRSRAQTVTKTPTYAQLKKSLKVNANTTLEIVRADPDSYAGRALEFSGVVTGTIAQNGARTVVLNAQDSVVRFAVAPEILNGDLLQAGASVCVLALVGRNPVGRADASSAVSLQPLAVMSAPKSDFVSKPDDLRDSSPDAISLLPPATDIPLFQSGNSAMPNIIRSGRTSSGTTSSTGSGPTDRAPLSSRAPISEDDSYGTFDSQMPAYRAMVRRFNPKLTPDLVDKIVLALLQAGTANGMDPRFLASIISVESDFDIYCRSNSGAMGLGQLMPFNLPEAHITNAWDPVQNVWGTARLLRGHLNDYRNRADGTLLAVAAYNAGPGAVRRAGYRVPGGSQVQRYVWKVYNRYKEFAPDMFNKR